MFFWCWRVDAGRSQWLIAALLPHDKSVNFAFCFFMRPFMLKTVLKRRILPLALAHALALAGALGTAQMACAQPAVPALVAAAANMQTALTELLPLFEKQGKGTISLSLGSSANLVRQIQQGLPAELFLSADEDFAYQLADSGLTPDRGVVYAIGRLVLVVPKGSALRLDAQLAGLKDALNSAPGSVQKFAIANPELAPYGKAAVQALQKQAAWTLVQPKLVMGESIAQATQYVSSGAASAGISALALVLAPAVADRVRYVVVARELHAPIRQRMVLLKTAGPTARAFYGFLQSPAAKLVLQRHGYE